MLFHPLDSGEYIFEARLIAVLIYHDQWSVIMEQRQHVAFVFLDDERVGLASRLIYEGPFGSGPVMLQIAPTTIQRIGGDGGRVTVAANDTFAGGASKVDPGPLRHIVHQGAKPNIVAAWHPHALIVFFGVDDDDCFKDRPCLDSS